MIRLIKPKFWQTINLLSLLLTPFSLLYYLIHLVTNALKNPYHANLFVVCVGDAIIGGSGKTPLAIELAKIFKDQGKKVCFLSRGYLGSLKKAALVESHHSAIEVGDEALLLKNFAPTIVSKYKVAGLKLAESLGIDVVIMDDGLQSNDVIKDLSLLVIDGTYKFGNELLFPAGPMREPKACCVAKVNAIIVIGNLSFESTKPVFRAKIKHNKLDTKFRLFAFAGIGNPAKFFESLTEAGGMVVGRTEFPDHHFYSAGDLDKLTSKSQALGAKLITTEKDFVKIPQEYHNIISFLPMELSWENQDLSDFLMREYMSRNVHE